VDWAEVGVSGASDIHVDPDALAEVARSLGQVRAVLEEAEDVLTRGHERLGSERIEEALDDFVSGWRDGRRRIIRGLEGLVAKCHRAVDAYLANERRIIDSRGAGR
jgi:hypothetical protein